jgi:hypothetical protein
MFKKLLVAAAMAFGLTFAVSGATTPASALTVSKPAISQDNAGVLKVHRRWHRRHWRHRHWHRRHWRRHHYYRPYYYRPYYYGGYSPYYYRRPGVYFSFGHGW